MLLEQGEEDQARATVWTAGEMLPAYPRPARVLDQREGFSVLGHGKSFAITRTALNAGRTLADR
jgi:hypothetical protein